MILDDGVIPPTAEPRRRMRQRRSLPHNEKLVAWQLFTVMCDIQGLIHLAARNLRLCTIQSRVYGDAVLGGGSFRWSIAIAIGGFSCLLKKIVQKRKLLPAIIQKWQKSPRTENSCHFKWLRRARGRASPRELAPDGPASREKQLAGSHPAFVLSPLLISALWERHFGLFKAWFRT